MDLSTNHLPDVTLVIPGRDCAGTIGVCLEAVTPLLDSGGLREIVFVDDASTDATAQVVARYPVRVLRGRGLGPGHARNLGWRSATTPLVWFIDSDCVAEEGALELLLARLTERDIAGVGGSYSNGLPDSLLASLIHEEIVARHRRMPREVNFLATFNVLYRRAVLAEVEGFDESLRLAQDAELAFRIRQAGHRLRFEPASRVAHFHPTSLRRYLRTQTRQGYYRILLYRRHPQRMKGDSYSGLVDHVQPPLAMLLLATIPFTGFGWGQIAFAAVLLLLWLATLPMTLRLARHTRQARYLLFSPLSFVRAIGRGLGLSLGTLHSLRTPRSVSPPTNVDAVTQRRAA